MRYTDFKREGNTLTPGVTYDVMFVATPREGDERWPWGPECQGTEESMRVYLEQMEGETRETFRVLDDTKPDHVDLDDSSGKAMLETMLNPSSSKLDGGHRP